MMLVTVFKMTRRHNDVGNSVQNDSASAMMLVTVFKMTGDNDVGNSVQNDPAQ